MTKHWTRDGSCTGKHCADHAPPPDEADEDEGDEDG